MVHQDHVRLLQQGVPGSGGVWADLGSGSGAFTLALAELIGPAGEIYSIDKDARALKEQEHAMDRFFPPAKRPKMHYLVADFTRPVDLPPLDGIVMANSLHFQRHKDQVLAWIRGCLKPGGRLILVEYNADQGNPWVPYPLSFPRWKDTAAQAGFAGTRLLATQPSRFLREIYSALSFRP